MTDLHRTFSNLRIAGGFRVIMADPGTRFEARSEKGEAKSPQAHYTTMPIDEICAVPVELLAADDCALFLWMTWPLMPKWNAIIESWGFKFSGLAWEWIKYNPDTGKYAFGNGYGTRKNLEPCLLATRGNPSLRAFRDQDMFGPAVIPEGVRSVRDFIEWNPLDAIRSKRREHSRKPDEQYVRIETLFDGPYIELFNRTERPGWTAWGDQAGLFTTKFAEAAE